MDHSIVFRDFVSAFYSALYIAMLPLRRLQWDLGRRFYVVISILTACSLVTVTILRWGHGNSLVGQIAFFSILIADIGASLWVLKSTTVKERARIRALITPAVVRWAIGIVVIGGPLCGWFMIRYL